LKRSIRPRTVPWRSFWLQQARGWQLDYAELKDIWLRDGIAWGRLAPLKVFDDPRTWYAREPSRRPPNWASTTSS
jgi:hypothetical protein